MTCGDKKWQLRLKKGFGQAELSRKAGLSPQTLFKYEKNIITNIPLNSIINISKALDVDASELVNWYDNEPEQAIDNILLDVLTDLTEEETIKVIAYVEGLKANR